MHQHHQKYKVASLQMKLGFIVCVALLLLYLWLDHRPHLSVWSPYLIFLLCPLMHFFMHKRHGDHEADEPKPSMNVADDAQ